MKSRIRKFKLDEKQRTLYDNMNPETVKRLEAEAKRIEKLRKKPEYTVIEDSGPEGKRTHRIRTN